MKLSEALRIGIQKKPKQGFGSLSPESDSSCAVGAILDGLGMLIKREGGYYTAIDRIDEEVPGLFKNLGDLETLWSRLIRMNDREKKTREEIADWLEAQGD